LRPFLRAATFAAGRLATAALFTASALLTTGLTASSALVLLVFIVWHFTLPVRAIEDLLISPHSKNRLE
jgi:hypothetical protein